MIIPSIPRIPNFIKIDTFVPLINISPIKEQTITMPVPKSGSNIIRAKNNIIIKRTEYAIHQKADGSLILIPKISNPYTSDAKFEDVPGPEREAWENMAMEELRHAEE